MPSHSNDLLGHVELVSQIIENARASLDAHTKCCDASPHLVLMNPGNFELLKLEELLGLSVLPDEGVEPMRCRLVCGKTGRAGVVEGREVVWCDGEPYVAELQG